MGFRVSRFNIGAVGLFSLILFTGVLSIPGFSSQPNEIIDDFFEQFSFDLIQLTFATTHTPAYSNVTSSSVSVEPPGDFMRFEAITAGTVPDSLDSYINSTQSFGYAWLDSVSFPANAVVSVMHSSENDSASQQLSWHGHNYQLDSNGCLSVVEDASYFVSQNDNVMTMYTVGAINVNQSTFQSTSSFELVLDSTNCPAPLNGLKLVK